MSIQVMIRPVGWAFPARKSVNSGSRSMDSIDRFSSTSAIRQDSIQASAGDSSLSRLIV